MVQFGLHALLSGDADAVRYVTEGLSENGWSVLGLDLPELADLRDKAIDCANKMLTPPAPVNAPNAISKQPVLTKSKAPAPQYGSKRPTVSKSIDIKPSAYSGYGCVWKDYKSSVRLLTGCVSNEFSDMPAGIRDIGAALDTISMMLATALSPSCFGGRSIEQLGIDGNIPAFKACAKSRVVGPGMLDVVSYRPNIDIGCAAHVDPGLFVISLGSTSPGLQLLHNATQEYYSPEARSVVIWCGDAAQRLTGGKIKAAVHRVVKVGPEGRSTIWYEACTADQLPPVLMEIWKPDVVIQERQIAGDITIEFPIPRKTKGKEYVPSDTHTVTITCQFADTLASTIHSIPSISMPNKLQGTFMWNGKVLDRSQSLLSQGVTPNATVQWVDRTDPSFNITVNGLGWTNYSVGPLFGDSTLDDVKAILEEERRMRYSMSKSGFVMQQSPDHFTADGERPLPSNISLRAMGIQAGTTLSMLKANTNTSKRPLYPMGPRPMDLDP